MIIMMMAMMKYLVDNRLIGWPKSFLAAMSYSYGIVMLLDLDASILRHCAFCRAHFASLNLCQWFI